MAIDLFPAWVPVEALFVGSIVLLVAVLAMNRGRRLVVNLAAQDEPVLVAIGAVLIVATWGAGPVVVAPVTVGPAVGIGFVVLGVVSRYTDALDVGGVV